MKTTIKNLRQLIREQWYLERYENEIMNDESIKKKSVYVPDEIKDDIRSWLIDMGLAHGTKKKKS